MERGFEPPTGKSFDSRYFLMPLILVLTFLASFASPSGKQLFRFYTQKAFIPFSISLVSVASRKAR